MSTLIFNCENTKVIEQTETELIVHSLDNEKLIITGEAKESFLNILKGEGIYPSDSLFFLFLKERESEPLPFPDDLEGDSTEYVGKMPERYAVCVSADYSKRTQILNSLKNDKRGKDYILTFSDVTWDLAIILNLERNKILQVTKQQ